MRTFMAIFIMSCFGVALAIIVRATYRLEHPESFEHFWTLQDTSVRETTLTDGTRCAILGDRAGRPVNITCGWKR